MAILRSIRRLRRRQDSDTTTTSAGAVSRTPGVLAIGEDAEDIQSVDTAESCVALISSTIARLPAEVVDSDGRRSSWQPEWIEMGIEEGVPLSGTLAALLRSILTDGNGYLVPLERDEMGYPTMGELVDPRWVTFTETASFPQVMGVVRETGLYIAGRRMNPPDDVLHFAANRRAGYLSGRPPIRSNSWTIQTALRQRRYLYNHMVRGVKLDFLASVEGDVGEEYVQSVADILTSAKTDGSNVAVVSGGTTITPISSTHADAQMVESVNMVDQEIVRSYGVPSHMVSVPVMQSKSYASLLDDYKRFVEDTLSRWIELIESTFAYWLPEGLMLRFATDELTRPPKSERYSTWATGIKSGIISPEEVRLVEGLEGDAPAAPVVSIVPDVEESQVAK